MGSNDRFCGGAKPETWAILDLRSERLNKKKSFEIIKDKLKTFILSDFKNPRDIIPVIWLMHLMKDFKKKNAQKKLEDSEKGITVEEAMQQQRIKVYITREMEVQSSMYKLYGILIEQCS